MELDAQCDVRTQGPLDLRVDEQLTLADLIAPKWPKFSPSWSRFTNPTKGFAGLCDGVLMTAKRRSRRYAFTPGRPKINTSWWMSQPRST